MNSPLKAFDKAEPVLRVPERKKADVISIKPDHNYLIERLSTSSVAVALGDFKHSNDYRDNKIVDYLLIGVLSIVAHTIIVDHFKHSPLEAEQIEVVKNPPKVQISFVRPTPPPPPKVVQPPPPPKVVAINKPPKPKVTPKPAPKPVAPQPVQTTNIDTKAPVITAPPAPSAPPPPPPKPVEKVTQPRGSAGYKNNPTTDYPEVAAERGWEGRVVLKVHVLPSGKPDSVAVVTSSGHDILDSEAVSTVKKWMFEPAKRGDTPIDGWVNVPINFKLS
ncbi:MAG: energy transducer TonB [Methylococcales bacterium]